MEAKSRAQRNRTLTLREQDIPLLKSKLLTLNDLKAGTERNLQASVQASFSQSSGVCPQFSSGVCPQSDCSPTNQKSAFLPLNKTINADVIEALSYLPDSFADLIIIDPPYNLTKDFNGNKFNARSESSYDEYLDSWFPLVCKKLKGDGSLYICGDWKCTSSLQRAVEKQLTILNRITWQREKGRGAKSNWKNGMEDIWFAVKNPDDYYFNVEAVKIKRRVIAPYKVDGAPKDWEENDDGNFRLTYPSNFWDDISIPFWSMPENTDHPTQKPEKLYAKLILASSQPGDIVFDPFLGSGTASVTAKKLNRNYIGIEQNEEYCLWAEQRLLNADSDKSIQGYSDGVFWERNSLSQQIKKKSKAEKGEKLKI